MKKILLPLAIAPAMFLLTGCSVSVQDLVKTNMSESTYSYFYGKCDEFEMSISSGEREEPYAFDGQSREKCDFALAVMKLDSKKESESVVISINGDASSYLFEYNIVTGTYMFDLEKEILEDSSISVKYGNTEISLDCLSSEFEIAYEEALAIGVNEFAEELSGMLEKNELKCECYLKVLDNMSGEYNARFWCFSICDVKGYHYNCIIDVSSGKIVART